MTHPTRMREPTEVPARGTARHWRITMNHPTRPERPCERRSAQLRHHHPRNVLNGIRRPAEPVLWAGVALVLLSASMLVGVIVAQIVMAVLR